MRDNGYSLTFVVVQLVGGGVKKLFLRDQPGRNLISYYIIEPTSKYQNTTIESSTQAFEQSNGDG